ncbi:6-aminohexanoate-dimer hydrolase [Pseudoruegeria aquimaris]|uniref:6-aminohexanoate-dimer hydrolase n=1 Tax=Pseudoruegeria aquimaris TaxID=393663 RepID=A0A1Y5TRM7_9RHOB|nr:serine hydrolase [Pseudoruegeria aquimaris]SLN66503.1 6-aminohexanoate-dimer hydrolase [Pseudoruegeria aquimaris]
MRRFLKALGFVLLALAVSAAIIGIWKREEIARLLAVNSLFSEEKIVSNFSHMDRAFLHVEVPRGDGPVSDLPRGPEAAMPEGYDAWVKARNVTAIVALKNGEIRHEAYYQGTTAQDRRISWSVAKSYLSALLGVLLEEGAIASIDDPVIRYAPSLEGTAYEGATIRNVLNMASGVVFDENYLDPNSDINKMGRAIALGQSLDDFTRGLTETFAAAGEQWQYVSIDTHVIGMVIRGATGRGVAELLSEKIIAPLGLEESPYYVTDGEGVAFVLGGLNQRTRDYARFGQMILQDGAYGGRQIVPAAWLAASTAPSAPKKTGAMGYGFQWWIPPNAEPGEFLAQGVYGQYIYFNKRLGVVIASNAADRGFREEGVSDANIAMFRAIAGAL